MTNLRTYCALFLMFLAAILFANNVAARESFIAVGHEATTLGSPDNSVDISISINVSETGIELLPYIYEGDTASSTLSASFNGAPVEIIDSDDLSTGEEFELMAIDLTSFIGSAGELKFELQSFPATAASLTIFTSIEEAVSVPVPPLYIAGLFGLILFSFIGVRSFNK